MEALDAAEVLKAAELLVEVDVLESGGAAAASGPASVSSDVGQVRTSSQVMGLRQPETAMLAKQAAEYAKKRCAIVQAKLTRAVQAV
jgi:hypothetical protein